MGAVAEGSSQDGSGRASGHPELAASRVRASRLIAICAALTLLIATPVAADNHKPPPWRVVVLYGSDFLLPAIVLLNQALRHTLNEESPRPIDIYSEAVDAQRFNSRELEPEFLALMRKKYAGNRVDLVIAANSFALGFAERHRDELWPGAPILFHNIPEQLIGERKLAPHDRGIPTRFDFDGTLDLAVALQPEVRRVFVVGGVSERDRRWRKGAADAARRRQPPLEVEDVKDAPLGEILESLKRLPRDTIIYVTTVFRDAAGDGYTGQEVARRVAEASSVPVYSHFGTFLGTGVVGGALTDDAAEGRRAGKLALAMLSGQDVPPGPMLAAAPGQCRVDFAQLERWNLSQSRLPAGCNVALRPISIWEAYRVHIVVALAIIALQAALLTAFAWQLMRRRKAEREVEGSRAELAQAARLATLGELTATISHEVNQPLGAILSNAEAAEMLLEAESPRIDQVREILADIRRDDVRASEVVQSVRDLLRRQETARSPLDLDDVVNESLRLVGPEARRRGITIVTFPSSRPACVTGDRVQLRQALINLLINALDALADTSLQHRRVEIRTRAMAGIVVVRVRDNGPGIAPEEAPKLFNAFFTTKPNGIGLGLSMVRTIVEGHGGRIRARNHRTAGAAFVVVLPALDLPRQSGEVVRDRDAVARPIASISSA